MNEVEMKRKMHIDRMAEQVLSELGETDKDILIAEGDMDNLIAFHHGLGRYIRNEFGLWNNEHTPMLNEHGVDESPDHPDAVSMAVIHEVYAQLKAAQ